MKIRNRRFRRRLLYYPAAGMMALGSIFGLGVASKKPAPPKVKTDGTVSMLTLGSGAVAALRNNPTGGFREALRHGAHREMLEQAYQRFQQVKTHLEQAELDKARSEANEAQAVLDLVPQTIEPELAQVRDEMKLQLAQLLGILDAMQVTAGASGTSLNGLQAALHGYAGVPHFLGQQADDVDLNVEPEAPLKLDMNSYVEKEIDLFRGQQRETFVQGYRRSGAHLPFIQRTLVQHRLPKELGWLPLIESGFKAKAESQVKALGLWQFMPATGDSMGLERDRWIDKRMSPEQATEAAAQYLKYLHKRFGDWNTVLAAYNFGEGNVNKALRRSGRSSDNSDFWAIRSRLPEETARYVPKFQAVVHIATDPATYGFKAEEISQRDKPMHYELVETDKQMDMDELARAMGVEPAVLSDLNPELRQRVTPPQKHMLRVPVGSRELLIQHVASIPEYRPTPRALANTGSEVVARRGPSRQSANGARVARGRRGSIGARRRANRSQASFAKGKVRSRLTAKGGKRAGKSRASATSARRAKAGKVLRRQSVKAARSSKKGRRGGRRG